MKNFRPLSTFSILVGCWLVLGNLITHSNAERWLQKCPSFQFMKQLLVLLAIFFHLENLQIAPNDYLLNGLSSLFFSTLACIFFVFFNCKICNYIQDKIFAKFVSFVKELATYLNLKKLLKHEVKFLALSTNTEHDFDLWAVCTCLLCKID